MDTVTAQAQVFVHFHSLLFNSVVLGLLKSRNVLVTCFPATLACLYFSLCVFSCFLPAFPPLFVFDHTNHFIMVSCSARWRQSCLADGCLWISVASHISTVSNCCHYFPAFHIFKCYHSCPARTFQVLQHPLDVFPTILGCL